MCGRARSAGSAGDPAGEEAEPVGRLRLLAGLEEELEADADAEQPGAALERPRGAPPRSAPRSASRGGAKGADAGQQQAAPRAAIRPDRT